MLVRRGFLWVALVIATAGLAACSDEDAEEHRNHSFCPELEQGPRPPSRPGVLVLDGTGRLTRFSVPGNRSLTTRRLSLPSAPPSLAGIRLGFPGHYLANANSGAEIVLLQRKVAPATDALLVLDGRTLRTRCRYPLQDGARYRAVATTDESLIAFGNRPAGEKKNAALYTAIDAPQGSQQTRVVRPPTNDWFVESGAADNEQALVLTYHGSDTTGADLVHLDDPESKPVSIPEVHGSALAAADSFVAATGSGLVRIDAASGAAEDLDFSAEGVHLMRFALDERGTAAYVGTCGDRPSVNRLDLETGKRDSSPSGSKCGDLLDVADDRYAFLAVGPDPGGEIVDPDSLRLFQIDLEADGSSQRVGQGPPLAVLVETAMGSRE